MLSQEPESVPRELRERERERERECCIGEGSGRNRAGKQAPLDLWIRLIISSADTCETLILCQAQVQPPLGIT